MKRAAPSPAEDERPAKRARLPEGAAYWPTFLPKKEAAALCQELLRDSPWMAERHTMYGKTTVTKRQSCAYGDDTSALYRYAGVTRFARPWSPALLRVRDQLVREFNLPEDKRPNFALCNLYMDGSAGIGWHSDKIEDLVPGSAIYSLSLGAERDFQFRPIGAKGKDETTTLSLASGSLVTMTLEMQGMYKHCVPVRKGKNAVRVNVTFRQVTDAAASLGA